MAGKRFCGGCGQAMPVEAPSALNEEVAAADPVNQAVKPPEADAEETVPVVERFSVSAVTPWSNTPSFGPKAIPIPEWEPVKEVGQAPPVAPQAVVEIISSSPLPKRKIGLMVGIAAAVLVAAIGGWAWYAHTHRCVNCGVQSTAATATSGAIAQPAKPPAGTPEAAAAYAPLPAPEPVPSPSSAPAAPIQTKGPSQSGHANPVTATPELSVMRAPAPPPPPLPPAQARSGVRRYQGPPVPHGGLVVFDNLPKARLRFTFDRAAWELILKTNPDGTKKAILISQAQGNQSRCELGWELID